MMAFVQAFILDQTLKSLVDWELKAIHIYYKVNFFSINTNWSSVIQIFYVYKNFNQKIQ